MPGDAKPTLKVEIDLESAALSEVGITWVDVTAYVKGPIRIDWGREKAVDEFQPGGGSFTLDNRSGIFDPSNSTGTHYGKLKPRRKVRIQAFGDGAAGHLPTGGYTIASGWLEGWPQRPIGRKLVDVDIRFYDFLAVAARLPMPDSVYDWQIKQTTPYAWYRMKDTSNSAIDASGNGRDGSWRVFDGYTQPWQGLTMQTSVLQAGAVDPVIAGSGRPARSWSGMQAEITQPLGAIVNGTPRTPALVCHQDTAALLAADFSVEFWINARQAFPLDITNQYSTTTPMSQPVVTWGVPGAIGAFGGVRYEFAISSSDFVPSVNTFLSSGSGSGIGYGAMTGGEPHQVVYVYDKAAPTLPALAVYVDGVLRFNYDITSITSSTGFDPNGRQAAVIGYATGLPSGLQSTLGDIVFWDRKLTAAEVLKNYRAGRYGNLELGGGNVLTVPNAFTHAFSMAGAAGIAFNVLSVADPLEIEPGSLAGMTLADYLRRLAATEQGPLYWDPAGSTWGRVQFRDRNWVLSDTQAVTSQATLSDASGAAKGYSEVVYRDGSDLISNDITVRFAGGEQRARNEASITAYGPVAGSIDSMLISRERATQLAEYRAWKFGQPPATTIVPERVSIEPGTLDEFNTAARARPGQRLTLVRTRPDATTLTVDYWIDGVAHEIEPEAGGAWRTTLTVSPADDPAAPFVFGTSTFGSSNVFWI